MRPPSLLRLAFPVGYIYVRASRCETAIPLRRRVKFFWFSWLGSLENPANCFGDAVPVGALSFELSLSGFREFIKLSPSIVFRHSPLRLDPAAFLHTVKRRIERAILDFEQIFRRFVYALNETVAVHRSTRQSVQDQQLQRALHQVRAFTCHEVSPLDCQGQRLTEAP